MKVKFVPQNIECEIKLGESVMHVAHENGIYIKSVCKGVPSCAECRVRIVDGEYNVLPPGSEELSLIGTGYFIDRRRLACQLKCFGDITVDMTEQLEKQQEILSGQKKKFLVQDDRIEEAHTIRSDENEDEASPSDEDEELSEEEFGAEEEVADEAEDETLEAGEAEEVGAEGEVQVKAQKQSQGGRRRRRRRGGRRGRQDRRGPGGGPHQGGRGR